MGGKTSAKAKNTWIAKAYDRINFTVPKGEKETIQTAAQTQGQSVNAYIYEAVKQRMEREQVQGGGIRLVGELSSIEQ